MDSGPNEGSEARFAAYVEALGAVLGPTRHDPQRPEQIAKRAVET